MYKKQTKLQQFVIGFVLISLCQVVFQSSSPLLLPQINGIQTAAAAAAAADVNVDVDVDVVGGEGGVGDVDRMIIDKNVGEAAKKPTTTTTTTTKKKKTILEEDQDQDQDQQQNKNPSSSSSSSSSIISTATRTTSLEGHGIVRVVKQEQEEEEVEVENENENENEGKKKGKNRHRSLRSKKYTKKKKNVNVVTPVKVAQTTEEDTTGITTGGTTTTATSDESKDKEEETKTTTEDKTESEDEEVNASSSSSSDNKEDNKEYEITKPIISRDKKYNDYYKEYCTTQRMEMYLPNHEQSCESAGQREKPYIRTGDFTELHPEEATWVEKRLQVTTPKIRNFVQAHLGIDIGTQKDLKIANIYSGGGKRAMLTASGVASGLNDMGILDHATWMGGLSGGSWFISNLYSEMYTNKSTVYPEDITEVITPNLYNITKAFFNDLYELKNTFSSGIEELLQGKGKYTAEIDCYVAARNNYDDYDGITDTQRKLHAPDVWGQITGYTFLSSMETGGLGTSFSDLREYNAIQDHAIALPVFTITQLRDMDFDLATEKNLEKHDLSVTPFDMSFYDDSGSGSIPTAVFGSSFNNGEEQHADEHGEDTCQTRMDQWSMIMGLSSWAIGMVSVDPDLTPFGPMASTVVDSICNEGECKPFTLHNPYYNYSDTGIISESETIDLLDGAGVSNLPLYSFVNKGREADIVIAFDSSGENTGGAKYSNSPQGKSGSCASFTTEYPDGGAIRDTQAFIEKYGIAETSMPTMPTKQSEWRSGNDYYLRKNTFFGCDEVKDKTSVVYIPNRPVESCKNGIFIAEGIFDMHFNFGIFDIPLTQQWEADSAQKTMVESIQNVKSENFDICLACLYAVKAAESTDLWESNETCKQCYSDYCFTSDELKRQMDITKEQDSNNDDIEDFVGDLTDLASGFGF